MISRKCIHIAALCLLPILASAGTIESLDSGWRFIKGDDAGAGTNLSYAVARPWLLPTANPFTTNAPAMRPEGNFGDGISFAQPGFDDSGWRLLNLPHDFGVEAAFDPALPGATGKLPWSGVAWYRKHLDIPAGDAGRKIYLDVDGAMAYAEVWLNGKFVGGWPYGYASWRVDLTPYLNFGGENVVAIRLDNPPDSSRWYPGGGIYRNVWLVKTAPIHIAHWGTYVTTPAVGAQSATVKIQVDVDNDADSDSAVRVKNEIFELNSNGEKGKAITEIKSVQLPGTSGANGAMFVGHGGEDYLHIAPHSSQLFQPREIILANPKLWSLEKPNRYVVVTTISQAGKIVDSSETPFGIRTIAFTVDNGFLLNGKRVPINGICDHSDLGALGSAINVRGLERQIEILKSFGCNAIRTSHNPPSPELLDLCDKMGMLVMDESFDCWQSGKTRNDYHLLFNDWHERDWRAELRRDRNHPSIILWSIGNEVGEQNTPSKFWIPAELTAIAHQEDPTRPTTSANSDVKAGYNGFNTNEDVFGYNYKPTEYGKFRAANPNDPLFGSETASCVSSRGEYVFPVSNNKAGGKANNQVSSYDLYAPQWATPPDWEFKGQESNPFVAGEFVWTGFDYLGEPTPFDKTSRSSYFGIVDLDGFPKDRFYLYQARWRPDFPMAHILPHWNWPERAAQTMTNADGSVTNQPGLVTPVMVYTSGDSAELFLNGKSLGLKKKGQYEYRLRWDDVVYQPGTLKVVACKNGKEWATDEVKTTGAATQLMLQPDRAKIAADGKDLSFVTMTIADQNGLLVPRSKNHIKFDIAGPGEIVAVDDGDPTNLEPMQAKEHDAFNGLALVIIRASKPGKITLTARADGLEDATARITAQ
jgi:beta-galactosidase